MNHRQLTYQVDIVHDNLRSLDLIKQYCKSERIKGLIIGEDAKKAFYVSNTFIENKNK